MKFPTYEQMAKDVAEKALDEILYNGRTIREWLRIIAEQEPKTGHWIPASNPPKQDGKYFVTRHDKVEILGYANNLYKVDKHDFWNTERAGWYEFSSEYGYCECDGVTAWCELPEPYKAENKIEQCSAYADQDTLMSAT